MGGSALADDVIVACAQDLAARLDDVAVQLSDQLSRSIPEFFADEDLAREAQASAQGNVDAMLAIFRGETTAAAVAVRPEVVAFASSVAQRRLPLELLVQSYRVGQTLFSRLWMDVLAAHVTEQDVFIDALHRSFDDLNAYLDRVVGELIAVYEHERERWLRGAAARRAELVERLLRGEPVDRDRATRQLGHDLTAPQTALVAWTPSGGDAEGRLAALDACLSALAAAGGTGRVLTLPAGTAAMWGWIAGAVDHERLRAAADALPERDVLLAIGDTAEGADAFRISHDEALRARRVASRMAAPPRLTRHADIATVALLTADPDQAARFVARTLGTLAERTDAAARLRETLWVLLQERGNARRAGERLHTHRNTVLYRLGRAEAQLGGPLDDRRLDVEIALLLVATLGEAVLPPGSS